MARAKSDNKSSEDANIESAVALTGHTHTKATFTDPETGKVQASHQTTVVTDPESDLAVQIPDGVSGEADNPLGVHAEPSPNDVFDGGAEPTSESVGDKGPGYLHASTPNDETPQD